MNESKQFGIMMLKYAHDHQNQFPTNFDQMASYFDTNPELRDNANEYEIVYEGRLADLIDPASTIIACQKQPLEISNGKRAKIYSYTDGHSEVQVATDGNFDLYERTHIVASKK
jgi:hypothetical protein